NTFEDVPLTLTATSFGFTDPNDQQPPSSIAPNTLLAVKITSVPANGSLQLSGSPLAPNQFVTIGHINLGNLKFVPTANQSGSPFATFSFQVQDNGGTANGGVDLDQSPNALTINVLPVNDPPSGADKTVTLIEKGSYTFQPTDFAFSDPNDSPA